MVTVRNNRRDVFTWELFVDFLKHFHKQCKAKGMTIPPPADYLQIDGTAEVLQARVEICMQNNVEFILFVTDDAIKNLHNFMKRWEINSGIVTQDINSRNAYEIVSKHKVQTLENIVNKTNIKLGGLNYSIIVEHAGLKKAFAETLFIGLGMSHPAAQTAHERARDAMPGVPSVTGYAANFKTDPFDFVGDFVFDEPRRDEKYPVVSTIVENCVKRYVENRHQPPKRLVIFRNGTSEGQFASILRFEVPFIRNALQQSGAPECLLTLLVPQKMHKVRIFPETETKGASPAETNIKPGTVVDTGLVHPMYNEYYLNSHQAIQGSAKTPRYTVLVDENEFPMDIIESITYDLSFSHQIVTLATSLPSPAYIALEYAKRGRNNYSVFRQEGAQNDPDSYLPDGSLNYEHISNRLNYSQVPSLRNKRVNA
ncbi:WAGO-2 protein [Aphelenchoides avenae]|nr:WAGO-2 protein [Aphelenchus avenae]